MAVFDAFIGPSYTAQSVNVDCENSMNLYAEAIEGGGSGKARIVLYGTPGITLFGTLPTTPVRGMWANASRLFVAAGTALYEVFSDGTYNSRGFIPDDAGHSPVQMFANGNQLLLVVSGIVYLDNGTSLDPVTYSPLVGFASNIGTAVGRISGDTFDATLVGETLIFLDAPGGSPIGTGAIISVQSPDLLTLVGNPTGPQPYTNQPITVSPNVLAASGAFLDSYYIVAAPNSKQFNWSVINDGSTWDYGDFATKAAYPDNIVALLADHEELWIFGTDTTEVFQDTGAATPFQRIPGALIHHGCAAPASPARLQNGVAWLSSDPARGGTIAYLAQGFQPTRVSTHAVETAWAGYSTVADAISFTYTERGHEYWVITFPTGNATWAFDATAGWWHQRGWWNGSSLDRQRQMFHAFVFGKHLVGDWENGNIYQQSLGLHDDNGTAIHRIRTAPHLSNEQLWSFYARFQLDLELGQSATSPSVLLQWSDDGGHTFNAGVTATPTNATFAARVIWRRLGRSRDRVWRVTITDAVRIALIRAILDVEQGTN